VSSGPPAAKAMTMVTGRVGQSCACAVPGSTMAASAAVMEIVDLRIIMSSLRRACDIGASRTLLAAITGRRRPAQDDGGGSSPACEHGSSGVGCGAELGALADAGRHDARTAATGIMAASWVNAPRQYRTGPGSKTLELRGKSRVNTLERINGDTK